MIGIYICYFLGYAWWVWVVRWIIVNWAIICLMQRCLLLIWLFAIVFSLSSCTYFAEKRRLLVYTELIGTNDTVNKMTRQWYQMVSVAVKTKNFSTIGAYRLTMASYLNKKREKIAELSSNADTEGIVDSEQTYLSNQAFAVADIYFTMESYNYLTPAEDIQDQMKLIIDNVNGEMAMYEVMKKALHSFAKRHALKVINVTL